MISYGNVINDRTLIIIVQLLGCVIAETLGTGLLEAFSNGMQSKMHES